MAVTTDEVILRDLTCQIKIPILFNRQALGHISQKYNV